MIFISAHPAFIGLCDMWWVEEYPYHQQDEVMMIGMLSDLSDALTAYMFGEDTPDSKDIRDAMDIAISVIVNYIDDGKAFGVVNRIGLKDIHGSFFIDCENTKCKYSLL